LWPFAFLESKALDLLQEIKTELRYSSKTIAEISHDLHFSDPNNLTRFFTKMEGLNPVTYRKNYQNDRIVW
jgi:AraC-like DNA-binding protein